MQTQDTVSTAQQTAAAHHPMTRLQTAHVHPHAGCSTCISEHTVQHMRDNMHLCTRECHMKYYLMALIPENDGTLSAYSPDFPEMSTMGASVEECMVMSGEALRIIVEEYVRQGREVPEPCALIDAKSIISDMFPGMHSMLREAIVYQYIPVPVSDDGTTMISVTMPRSDLRDIDRKSRACGMTRSQFIVSACRQWKVRK